MKSSYQYKEQAVAIGQALADIQSLAVQDLRGNDLDLVLFSIQRLKKDLKSGYNKSLGETLGEGEIQLLSGIF